MNEIIYRKNKITNVDIVSGNCLFSHAMTGESLAADTIDFTLWSDTGIGKVDADFITSDSQEVKTADGDIFRCFTDEDYTKFVPGDSLEYKKDDALIGKFYLRDVKRSGKHAYDFYGVSVIGILGDTMHYGGIYTGQTVASVAAELLEGIPYEVDALVGDIKLYGWLPIATKRDNLQQITIATAIAVKTKPNGTLLLTALSNDIKGVIGVNRMAIGGKVAVDTPYSAVQVSEHYYREIAEEIVLFSESSVKTEFLKFNEPVHDLTVTGGTLIASGSNFAIVECNGFTEIKAKRYLHTTRTVTIGTVDGIPSDKIYSVNNATLITSLNSSGVAQKLYEAYTKPKTIQANVFHGTEKSGDVVSVINPYSEEMESAFLKKQDMNIGKTLMANSDFVVDFTPSGAVTGYKNRVVLTEGEAWQVPSEVTEIRATLISGAQGGQGGFDGEDGALGGSIFDDTHTVYDGGKGGKGGKEGAPGSSAKILDITLPVTPEQIIPITIGTGGVGGINGSLGEEGAETTFGSYTTADGAVQENGFVDIVTAELFAGPGNPGIPGADGGDGSQIGYGSPGDNTDTGTGGPGGDNYSRESGTRRSGGAGGGGAAHDSDGLPGGDAFYESSLVNGGDGGDGASPSNLGTTTSIGFGGDGGHGGGGGGGAGGYKTPDNAGGGKRGNIGIGGIGSQGSTGGPGLIIIYY